MQHAPLPGGAEVGELVVHLPHVTFPFDFREGIERFRHHRGDADGLEVQIEARVVLDWLFRVSGGAIVGSAHDDALVLSGRIQGSDTRFTVRARVLPDRAGKDDTGEPLLVLSLYQVRAYGPTSEPWPLYASQILDLLPKELVVDRTLTTARLRFVRQALGWALSELGWKVPDVRRLVAHGVELREGRFIAVFGTAEVDEGLDVVVASDGEYEATRVGGAFQRFVEDLELKRHHGQIDRLLGEGKTREALAEVYRAMDGAPRPGFLAERLIGICASQPVLYDEGERVCRELLDLARGYEPALCGLAAIQIGRGRPEEAAVDLERLVDAMQSGVAHGSEGSREDANVADLTRARLLAELDPEVSRGALERVLERAPDHEEALSALIDLAEAEGDLRRALPLYKRLLFAARSKERTRSAGLRLARHALDRHEPEDARVLLRVVLEAAPDDQEAQLALAEVEAQEGHGQEAQRILEAALRQLSTSSPKATPAGHSLAVRVIVRLARLLLESLADPARARRVLWRAGDLGGLDEAALLELSELAVRSGEPILALRFAGQLSVASSLWPRAQAVRARAFIVRGDARAALAAITEVLKREPDSSEALELLEQCAPDPARRELLVHELHDSALRVPPGPSRARILHRVAVLYESLGLKWDALEPLTEAVFEAAGQAVEASDKLAAEARATRLMALQAEFGSWTEHQRTGALRLGWLPSRGELEQSAGVGSVQTRIDVLVALGRAALVELGDPYGARTWLEEAIKLSPRHLDAHELLAAALDAVGQGGVAGALVQVLSRLEAIRPDDVGKDRARVRLAEVQLEALGSPGQARATLGRVSAASRADVRVQALRRRAGMDAPAAPPVVAAPVRAEPVASPSAAAFGDALRAADAGELVDARRQLRQILTRDPSFAPARDLLAILPEDAPIETVEPTLEAKVSETDRIEQGLATATERFFGDDLSGARAALEEVLALDPDVSSALELLVEVLGALGDRPARVAALEKLVEIVFDRSASARYTKTLADDYEVLGDIDAMHNARMRYLRLNPLDLATWESWEDALTPEDRDEILEARAEAED